MARKIGIIHGSSQTPKTYVKKSVAALLVRRLLAIWVIENVVIKMVPYSSNSLPIKASEMVIKKPYIPDKLPASIDGMLGLIVQAPVLPNQIRFRHV